MFSAGMAGDRRLRPRAVTMGSAGRGRLAGEIAAWAIPGGSFFARVDVGTGLLLRSLPDGSALAILLALGLGFS